MEQVTWHDASRSQWQEYALEIGKILYGDPKRLTRVRGQVYLPTKFGCDQSIVVGCRSQNDRQTDKQTE